MNTRRLRLSLPPSPSLSLSIYIYVSITHTLSLSPSLSLSLLLTHIPELTLQSWLSFDFLSFVLPGGNLTALLNHPKMAHGGAELSECCHLRIYLSSLFIIIP